MGMHGLELNVSPPDAIMENVVQAVDPQNIIICRVQIPEFVHSQEDFPMLHGPHLTKPHLEKLTTSAEGIEAWSNFFCAEKNKGPIITNRGPWVDFFTASLVSPASFDWARRVLSNMWQVFTEGSDECKKFFLPDCCPSKEPLICKLSARAANISQGF